MLNGTHDLLNPTHIAGNEFRRNVEVTILREQPLKRLNSILCRMRQERITHATKTLSISDNSIHSRMRQNVIFHSLLRVKNIVLHYFSFMIRMLNRFFGIFQSIANNCIHSFFLLIIKRIKDILDGLFSTIFAMLNRFTFFVHRNASVFQSLTDNSINGSLLLLTQRVKHVFNCFFIVGHIFFLFFRMDNRHRLGMRKRYLFSRINNCFIIHVLAMTNNRIYERTRISPSQYKTNLSYSSVKNIGSLLLQLIRINRQSRHVSMFNQQFCILSRFGIVQCAISVDTLVSIFQ